MTGTGSTACFGPYRGHAQRLRRGEVLFQHGEPVDALFRIRRGLVKLVTYLSGGEARIVRLQRAGDWLGLAGFLDRPYGHTAIALSEVTVERFAMECLARMRHDDAEALNELLSQWHRDLAAADVWIAQFSTGSIRQRVARLIRYLAALEEADATRVHLPTVREMGEILGVRPESVSRVLADLKRKSVLLPAGRGRHDTYRISAARLAALRAGAATSA
jgi:CRP/FNR family transcriptional regulator